MPINFWNDIAVTAVARRAALNAIKAEAEAIGAVSQMLVPLNKEDFDHRGTLMRTMHIESDEEGSRISYSVADVAGEDYDYAELQHENLWFSHEPGRVAKYLQIPFNYRVTDPTFFMGIELKVRQVLRRTL